jgi:predicted PurR-regulated permease PerM
VPPSRTSPLFILVATIAIVASLYLAKEILLPIALAILLSFLLTPLVDRIERLRIGRVPSVLVVVALAFMVIGVLGWVVTSQVIDISRQLPDYKSNLIAKIHSVMPRSTTFSKVTDTLQDLGKELTAEGKTEETAEAGTTTVRTGETPAEIAVEPRPAEDAVKVKVVEMPPSPLEQIQSWLGPLVAPLTTAVMVIVLLLFLLINREDQRDRLLQLFGTANLHSTTEAFVDATSRVSRYLRMQFILNASYGLAVGIGLWLIGVPNAAMWGVLSFSLRFLPYIGPWIGASMPIVVSLAVSPGWLQPLLAMGWFVVLELILNNVAEPWLYGSSVGVSSVGVIVAAIFWTWLWGPIGLVLAMPMTVCLMVSARYVPQLWFLRVLLADRPALSLSERIYQRLLAFDYREPLKLAKQHLKSATLASYYDDVLIPALKLAEADRHAGQLNQDQEAFVQEAAQDLVAEVGALASAEEPAPGLSPATNSIAESNLPPARVLCIPLRDEADETVCRMLTQLLSAEGLHAECGDVEALTSELVERVAEQESDVVVISIMPPIAPRDSWLLWKRLRKRYPNLPLVVGFWSGSGGKQELVPAEDGNASRVATTLAEAVTLVRAAGAQRRLVAKTG